MRETIERNIFDVITGIAGWHNGLTAVALASHSKEFIDHQLTTQREDRERQPIQTHINSGIHSHASHIHVSPHIDMRTHQHSHLYIARIFRTPQMRFVTFNNKYKHVICIYMFIQILLFYFPHVPF